METGDQGHRINMICHRAQHANQTNQTIALFVNFFYHFIQSSLSFYKILSLLLLLLYSHEDEATNKEFPSNKEKSSPTAKYIDIES